MRPDAHTDDWPTAATNWCWWCRRYFEGEDRDHGCQQKRSNAHRPTLYVVDFHEYTLHSSVGPPHDFVTWLKPATDSQVLEALGAEWRCVVAILWPWREACTPDDPHKPPKPVNRSCHWALPAGGDDE